MTKKQFTVITNKYLKQLNSKELDLNFLLSDNAQLTGSIKIFNQSLPFRLIMDVSVLSNKNLLLKPEEVSVGNLKISAQRVLELIEKQVKMPRYIKVNSKKTEIIMALEQVEFSKELSFKIQSIDLNNDRIVFNGYLNK